MNFYITHLSNLYLAELQFSIFTLRYFQPPYSTSVSRNSMDSITYDYILLFHVNMSLHLPFLLTAVSFWALCIAITLCFCHEYIPISILPPLLNLRWNPKENLMHLKNFMLLLMLILYYNFWFSYFFARRVCELLRITAIGYTSLHPNQSLPVPTVAM